MFDFLKNKDEDIKVVYIKHDPSKFNKDDLKDLDKYPPVSKDKFVINILPSPNFQQQDIKHEFVLMHATEETFENTIGKFLDTKTEVSSHFVVSPEGQIIQMVDPNLRAWHAGTSIWNYNNTDYSGINDYGVGIEVVNANQFIFEFPQVQFDVVKTLVKFLFQEIDSLKEPEQILGHEHVSAGLEGKLDPGYNFNWNEFYDGVFGKLKNYPYRRAMTTIKTEEEIKKNVDAYKKEWEEAKGDPKKEKEVWDKIYKILDDNCGCIQSDHKNDTPKEWTNFVLSDRSKFNCKK